MESSTPGDRHVRQSISGLLESGRYSDAKIVCGDQTFHIHKAVVCTQSEYFSRAFDDINGFKARAPSLRGLTHAPPHSFKSLTSGGPTQEARTNTIELQDISPSVVRSILEYMYHGVCPKSPDPNEELMASINVFAAAEMYQLTNLKDAAVSRFKEGADGMFHLPMLRVAVKSIYEGTVEQDRGLRDVIVDAAVRKMDDIVDDPAFNDTLGDVPAFAKDVVHAMHAQHKAPAAAGSASVVTLWCPIFYCQSLKIMDVTTYQKDTSFTCDICNRSSYREHWDKIHRQR
ncbi:BTB/POZ protein [Phyllosticta citribraziliensis]|uniref:BTB/POZ protein n=1 Tax=Phyllosticta citribraziliensis TaxID=989973 RepID=A0ABR1LNQ9_9PEZI